MLITTDGDEAGRWGRVGVFTCVEHEARLAGGIGAHRDKGAGSDSVEESSCQVALFEQ